MEYSQLLMLGLALAFLAYFASQFIKLPNAHHRRMRASADRALKKIEGLLPDNPGAAINYVRKLPPHAVEELVLSAAEAAGHKVRRNDRYVGDGGIDGMIEIAGVWHLVQTKRYSSAINPAHVAAFNRICELRRKPGLFISFGRTGPKSKSSAGRQIQIISGSTLIGLLSGRPLNPSCTAI